MGLAGKRVGFAVTASHCCLERALNTMAEIVNIGADVVPIISSNTGGSDSRFGRGEDWVKQAEAITGKVAVKTIPEAEPFGPQKLLDIILVLPCTGNTLAKLAHAITDSPVLMACKSQLRNGGPVVLAVTTNDGLGMNARNLGVLLASKNFFFVPFGQDNPQGKPTSIEAKFDLAIPTLEVALEGRQIQPLLVGSTH